MIDENSLRDTSLLISCLFPNVAMLYIFIYIYIYIYIYKLEQAY